MVKPGNNGPVERELGEVGFWEEADVGMALAAGYQFPPEPPDCVGAAEVISAADVGHWVHSGRSVSTPRAAKIQR